jgi:hypothetical protein
VLRAAVEHQDEPVGDHRGPVEHQGEPAEHRRPWTSTTHRTPAVALYVYDPTDIDVTATEILRLSRLAYTPAAGYFLQRHGDLLHPGTTTLRLDVGVYHFKSLRDVHCASIGPMRSGSSPPAAHRSALMAIQDGDHDRRFPDVSRVWRPGRWANRGLTSAARGGLHVSEGRWSNMAVSTVNDDPDEKSPWPDPPVMPGPPTNYPLGHWSTHLAAYGGSGLGVPAGPGDADRVPTVTVFGVRKEW